MWAGLLALGLASGSGSAPAFIDTSMFPGNASVQKPSVTAGNSHYVYVYDDLTNRLFVFDRAGKLLHTVGRTGPGPGEFYHATGLEASDSVVTVYDRWNRRVELFSPEGQFRAEFPAPSNSRAFAADGNGRVYINDPQQGHLISVYDSSGKNTANFGELTTVSALYQTKDTSRDAALRLQANRVWLATDKEGNVYASYVIAPVIRKYDRNGHLAFERFIQGAEADSLRNIFWHVRSGEKLLSSPFDGTQVDYITKAVMADSSVGRVYVLGGIEALFEFDSNGNQVRVLPIKRNHGGQILHSSLSEHTVLFTVVFQTGLYEARIPAP